MMTFVILISYGVSYAKEAQESHSPNCIAMVNYALSKHDEFSAGKSISELMDEENKSNDSEHKKFYKTLVIEILDTFAVWDDPKEKRRVNSEIEDHFYSICDPALVKDAFK